MHTVDSVDSDSVDSDWFLNWLIVYTLSFHCPMMWSSQCSLVFSKRTAPGMSNWCVAGDLNNYIAYAWHWDFSCPGEGHRWVFRSSGTKKKESTL